MGGGRSCDPHQNIRKESPALEANYIGFQQSPTLWNEARHQESGMVCRILHQSFKPKFVLPYSSKRDDRINKAIAVQSRYPECCVRADP